MGVEDREGRKGDAWGASFFMGDTERGGGARQCQYLGWDWRMEVIWKLEGEREMRMAPSEAVCQRRAPTDW